MSTQEPQIKKIYLDKFKPRPFQAEVMDAIFNKGYKKILQIVHRRCLSGESHILLPDGSFKLLKDIAVGDEILSWNGTEFVSDRVKHVWSTGIKETVTVKASKFLPFISSPDHVFAHTSQGSSDFKWKPVKDINAYQYLLNYAGIAHGSTHNPDLAEFWGYMLADGYVSHYQQPKFTNTNMAILKRVEHLAIHLFGVKILWRPKGNGFDLGMSNGTKGGGSFKNTVKELFRSEGCDIPKYERRLPKSIWSFDHPSLYKFFAALISADGSIYTHKKIVLHGKPIKPIVEITLSCGGNKEYAFDIYWLLRKLSIPPHVPILDRNRNWIVKVGASWAISLLLKERVYGKEDAQEKALTALSSQSPKTIINGCYLSQFKTSTSEPQQLFDIETETHHNFVANGYLVHNSGKDLGAFNIIIRAALTEPGNYLYVAPTFSQCRGIIWDNIINDGTKMLDFLPSELLARKNEHSMRLYLGNGSTISMAGSKNFDNSLIGQNPRMVVFTEFFKCDPRAYTYIRPALTANKGVVLINSTPRGKANHLYELYEKAKISPSWFVQHLGIQDTGILTEADIEKEREDGFLTEDEIQQEFYCSFSRGSGASFYDQYINQAELEERIGHVPWDPAHPVHTAWDLGMDDDTAIIFFQLVGSTIRIIDTYSNRRQGIPHYAKYLLSQEYSYGTHILPHDARVQEMSGYTRKEQLAQLGINSIIAPSIGIMDGIDNVRTKLNRVWIDQYKCKDLIKSLRSYRQEWDDNLGRYKATPVHDRHSHFCDATRMMMLKVDDMRSAISDDQIEEAYQRSQQIGSYSPAWDSFKNR